VRISKSRLIPVLVAAATLAGPAATAVKAAPQAGPSMPIDHVVMLMQENRSADHYLGHLYTQGVNYIPEPPGASNPNPLNPLAPPIRAYHETRYCEPADLDHSWNGSHTEWDNGAMDGFTKANQDPSDPTGSRTMGYYDQTDLPYYYALDRTFATGDHYFQSVLSQTFPNRFYFLTGTSFGHIRNDIPTGLNDFNQKTIFENLDAKGVSWKVYFSEVPFAGLFKYVREHAVGHLFPLSQYFIDAATGQLPQVSYVDPIFIATANTETDEHPPSNIQVGEKSSSEIINALMTSPNWSSSALFFTYDEHGGFFDHVPPPSAVPPDDIPPMLQPGDTPGAFDRLGFRVPMTVVSPYSKPGYVSHTTYDHTSPLKFLETRFGLPALTHRDAEAADMTDFFDFSHPSLAHPPPMPPAPIDPAQFLACAAAPPNTGV